MLTVTINIADSTTLNRREINTSGADPIYLGFRNEK